MGFNIGGNNIRAVYEQLHTGESTVRAFDALSPGLLRFGQVTQDDHFVLPPSDGVLVLVTPSQHLDADITLEMSYPPTVWEFGF